MGRLAREDTQPPKCPERPRRRESPHQRGSGTLRQQRLGHQHIGRSGQAAAAPLMRSGRRGLALPGRNTYQRDQHCRRSTRQRPAGSGWCAHGGGLEVLGGVARSGVQGLIRSSRAVLAQMGDIVDGERTG